MILSRTIVNQPGIAKEFWRKDKNHPLSNALLIRTLQKGIVDSGIYENDVPGQLTDSIMLATCLILSFHLQVQNTFKDYW